MRSTRQPPRRLPAQVFLYVIVAAKPPRLHTQASLQGNRNVADNILEASGVTKQFGGLTAVNSVDFEIERGSICSVIGPNGAGKTTFFNMITGVYTPTAGTLLFDG